MSKKHFILCLCSFALFGGGKRIIDGAKRRTEIREWKKKDWACEQYFRATLDSKILLYMTQKPTDVDTVELHKQIENHVANFRAQYPQAKHLIHIATGYVPDFHKVVAPIVKKIEEKLK